MSSTDEAKIAQESVSGQQLANTKQAEEAAAFAAANPSGLNFVSIETPFSESNGESLRTNIAYATACLKYSALLGEAPFASHLLLTRTITEDGFSDFISDSVVELFGATREVCIELSNQARLRADALIVYQDLGMSSGMKAAITAVEGTDVKVVYRTLPKSWMDIINRGRKQGAAAAAVADASSRDKKRART